MKWFAGKTNWRKNENFIVGMTSTFNFETMKYWIKRRGSEFI